MNAQQLKNSILQMAVQGKLVPQDPNDEPASVLLERIRKEKEKLIKEGKIKKEKNPSYIFRGADNTPYEKIGNAEPVSIADEVPFEIPDSWEWVRLGAAFDVIMGQSPAGESVKDYGEGIEFHQGKIYFGERFLNKSSSVTTSPTKIAPANSVLLCVRAPVGKVNITDREICVGRGLCAVTPCGGITTEFLYFLLETYEDIFTKQATGTTFTAITGEVVKKQLVPIPPIEEQKRIVEEIETLLPFVYEYGVLEHKLSTLNKQFPEQLRKSILQMAVQGKLVPQDPSDEPASVLLERIHAEKEHLIKEGKIKRDKNESIIFRRDNSHYEKRNGKEVCIDEEIPFFIPETWAWCRLGNIISIFGRIGFRGYTKNDMVEKGDGAITISPSNIKGMDTVFSSNSYISWDKYSESPEIMIYNDDLLVVKTGSSYGKCGIVKNLPERATINPQLVVLKNIFISRMYLLYALNSPFAKKQYEEFVIGTSIPTFSQEKLASLMLPIPPLREQERIAEAIKVAFSKLSAL